MRVLICGGRHWHEEEPIHWFFSEHLSPAYATIIHGGCPTGADAIAHKYAWGEGYTILKFPAEWNRHGSNAGPIRNQKMLDEGKPDLVVAFWNGTSPGTRDMITRARRQGIEVRIIYATGCEPKPPVQGSLL
jgi:hypothetical protein